MASDIASLGVEVRTGQVRDASTDLDKMASSATKAEKAVDAIGASSERNSAGAGKMRI